MPDAFELASPLRRYALPIVETVRQPLILLTTDFVVLTANAAFHRVFHTQPSEVEGRSFYAVNGGAWDRADLKELLEQVLPRDHDVKAFAFTQTFPGLGRRTLTIDACKLDDPDATSRTILIALEDRSLEAAQASRSLLMQEELSRSNRELEEFASIASHDLQEPLRKIRAFGQRLQARSASVLDGTSLDFLDRMLNAAARMSRLIDDVLRVARINHEPLHVVAVDLGLLLRELVGSDAGVAIGAMPTVAGDPGQLRQLFQNLLDNARKFHRPGVTSGIAVRASRHLPGWYAITVEDNGIGIAEQNLGRIFVMFQRLHGRSEYEGTGIGLALCRRIAERHGGSITAASTPGRGSEFTVVLPESVQPATRDEERPT